MISRSTVMTGMVGLAVSVPMIVFALWGGVLADRLERRSLVIGSLLGSIACALALAIQAFFNNESLLILYALAALQAAFTAAGRPARKSFISTVVPKTQVAAAVALTNASSQMALLLGPAASGILITIVGVYGSYVLEFCVLLIAIISMLFLPKILPTQEPVNQFQSFLDGLRMTWRAPLLRGSLMSDLCATTLAMPIALFPAMNETMFAGDPSTLGLFGSSLAAGGIVATLISGKFVRAKKMGRLQIIATIVWGASIAAAGFTAVHTFSLVFIFIAGGADTIAVIARGAIVQNYCTPELRGRVLAIEHVVGAAGPEIGNFRAGLLAAILPPPIAMAAGGISCVIGALAIGRTHEQFTSSKNDVLQS